MALDPKQQAEYNRLLKEGIELANKLGDAASKANFEAMPDSLKAGTDELRKLQLQVTALKKEWKDFSNDVSDAQNSFIRIVEEMKNTTKGINLASTAFSGLTSIAQKLSHIQSGISEASVKELKSLKEKTLAKIQDLSFSAEILAQNKKDLLDGRKKKDLSDEERKKYAEIVNSQRLVNKELIEGEKGHKLLLVALETEISKAEALKAKLGLTGAVIKGLSKIPILGDVINTEKALEAANQAAKDGASKFGVMGAALKSVGKDVKNALLDPLTKVTFAVTELFKTLISVDSQTGDLAKGFNLSYQEASKLRSQLVDTANTSADLNVTTKGLQESLMAVGNQLGSNASLNSKDLITMTKLREQAGLSNEELVQMEKLTLATGGNLENNTANLLHAAKTTALNNGVLLNEKQIMQEVSKASSATKLSLGGSAEQLGKAAAQAKALGMNLEQVDKIASSMLEIESSISNELEAELLTGRELNLEQARLYALNNDMEGLSKEIAKNFGSAAEFSKMNRIQQEAAAKAVGMSREELASTLTDQAALVGLSGQQAEAAKSALANARAQGMTEEEIKKKGIDGLMQQQSIQERLVATVEKLKEVFVTLVEPLMPILDIFTAILKPVGAILSAVGYIVKGLEKMGPVLLPIVGIMGALFLKTKAAAIMSVIKGAWESVGAIPFIGPALAVAAIAGGIGYIASQKADDMVSEGGYGKRTLMGPEGAISLNDKDTVIAGTNLFGNDIKSEPNKATEFSDVDKIKLNNETKTPISSPTSTQPVDIAPLIAEMQAMKEILNKILAKEGTVLLDSTKVGTTLNVGTSKIQ